MARRQVSFIISARNKGFMKALDQSAKRMDRFGRKMQRTGRKMSRFITLPALAAGGAAVKMATDFEASLSKVEGLVGVARREVQGMRGDVLALAGQTSRSPQELADALFFVTSAGLRGADAINVLEASARAAAAGLGETKTVADLVTSAVNAYGIENLSAAEATDILVAAVREGKAEAPELAESLGQVLPVASEMGVTFNEVAAAVASMTRTGTDAATASTQLRQIIFKILKPAKESERAFLRMGTSAAELRRQLREEGLLSVLGFFKDQMEDNEQAMAEAFPRVQALAGALDIMGSNAEENAKIFENLKDPVGSLDEAFEAAADTTKFKITQALSELRVEAINMGETLLPIVVRIIGKVREWVRWFSNLEEQTQLNILKWIGMAAAIGPILIGMGSMIRTGASLITMFTSLAAATSTLTAALTGLTGGLVVGFGALVVLIQRSINKAETFKNKIREALDVEVSGTEKELAKVTTAISDIGRKILELKQGMRDYNREATKIEIAKLEEQALKLSKVRDEIIQAMQAQGESNAVTDEQQRILDEVNAELEKLGVNTEDSSEANKGLGGVISKNNERYEELINKTGALTEANRAEMLSIQLVNTELERQLDLRRQQMSFIEGTERASRKIANVVPPAIQRVTLANNEATESTDDLSQKMIELSSNVAPMVGTAVSEMVESFVTGMARMAVAGGSLKNVFHGVIGVLADLAIRVGKIAVAVGVAIEGIKKALQSLNPVLAIGAGIALIALGTLAKTQLAGAPSRSVNDALVRSDGSIVEFHPDDNILAMRDFSGLKGGGGKLSGSVEFRIGREALVGVLRQGGDDELAIRGKVNPINI